MTSLLMNQDEQMSKKKTLYQIRFKIWLLVINSNWHTTIVYGYEKSKKHQLQHSDKCAVCDVDLVCKFLIPFPNKLIDFILLLPSPSFSLVTYLAGKVTTEDALLLKDFL